MALLVRDSRLPERLRSRLWKKMLRTEGQNRTLGAPLVMNSGRPLTRKTNGLRTLNCRSGIRLSSPLDHFSKLKRNFGKIHRSDSLSKKFGSQLDFEELNFSLPRVVSVIFWSAKKNIYGKIMLT